MGVISRFSRNAKEKKKEDKQDADAGDKVKKSTYSLLKLVVAAFLVLLFADITLEICVFVYEYIADLAVEEDDPHTGQPTPYEDEPVILWWTPFTGEKGKSKLCGLHSCFFTQNRKYQSHSNLKALLFYGTNVDVFDLPLPRTPGSVWSLLHEESPKNMPVLAHGQVLVHFNYTSTFSRYSQVPLTLSALESLDALKDGRFFVPTATRSSLRSSLAPVVYVQSICDAPTQRDDYVEELMKHIDVDSYGACLRNKHLPDSVSDPIDGMYAEEFYEILAKYKFVLALENGVCEDYITEKLWRPLRIGVVPIYYGSPSVKDWLPNPKSAILVSDFTSPKELAEYLMELDANETAYEEHLQHKIGSRSVTNRRLVEALENRGWGTTLDTEQQKNFVEAFECMVCERVSENLQREEKGERAVTSVANASHYQCPVPPSVLTQRPNPDNRWVEVWQMSRIEANVLAKFLQDNRRFARSQYEHRVYQEFHNTPEWKTIDV